MKKILAALMALVTGLIMCIPAAAQNEILAPLSVTEWQAGSSVDNGSSCFITRNTSITRDVTVPENSMLVVTGGATLKLTGKLTVKGALVVHYGAKINVQKNGTLTLGKNAVMVSNGTIAVSKGGRVRNYGYIQTAGSTSVKGLIKNYSSGTFTYENSPRTYSGGKFTGKKTRAKGAAQYYVQELESLTDKQLVLTDTQTGETAYTTSGGIDLIRSAEAILYKYDMSFGTQAFPSLGGAAAPDTDNRSVTAKPVGNYPQPLEFGLNRNGMLYINTTSAKDGTTISDIYKPCLGAENTLLFRSFFGEAQPGSDPALKDNASASDGTSST